MTNDESERLLLNKHFPESCHNIPYFFYYLHCDKNVFYNIPHTVTYQILIAVYYDDKQLFIFKLTIFMNLFQF